MSTIILVGIPLVAIAAIAICEPEIGQIIRELINTLVETTKYTPDQIVQIINAYF